MIECLHDQEACKDYDDIFQGAASKERAARDLLKSKRQEMDSVQFMINKVKNAMSVEDLDGQVKFQILFEIYFSDSLPLLIFTCVCFTCHSWTDAQYGAHDRT